MIKVPPIIGNPRKTNKFCSVSLCNRLLYAKKIVIEKEAVKEEDISLTIISIRKEFDWRIVRTQFIDIAVKLQDSRELQIGEIITVTVSYLFIKKTNQKLSILGSHQ